MLRATVPPAPQFSGYRSGAWYGVDVGTALAGNQAIAADTAYAFPIWFDAPALPDSIAVHIGTSVAGVSARLALYGPRPNTPAPGRLITGSLTNYDCGAAAFTPLVLTLPPGLRRPRGYVWGVVKANGAAQLRTISGASGTANTELTRLLGSTTGLQVHAGGAGAQVLRVQTPMLFADPWPDDFGTPSFPANAPSSPIFAWRHA